MVDGRPAGNALSADDLPPAPDPVGCSGRGVVFQAFGFFSGQFPIGDEAFLKRGRVGAELSLKDGRACAEVAALYALAQFNRVIGWLDRLSQQLRVERHVASAENFFEQLAVLDAASRLFIQMLGSGDDMHVVHLRCYGCHSMPRSSWS